MRKNIVLIIGSLRKDSINRSYANALVAKLKQMDAEMTITELPIGELALYNQDFDEKTIENYEQVRQKIRQADGILIATPEHNRTMPAALKNIIDIASRPAGKSVWAGKKTAIITASPGTYGAINAALDVRKSLQALSVTVMVNPEVYLAKATDNLTDGQVNNEHIEQFITTFAKHFIEFVQ